jgi:hypothetical protein
MFRLRRGRASSRRPKLLEFKWLQSGDLAKVTQELGIPGLFRIDACLTLLLSRQHCFNEIAQLFG